MKPLKTLDEIAEAILTRESQENLQRERKFYQQLGQFVSTFANVERQLLNVVQHYGKMDDGVAKAVFSGLRVDNGSTYLRRILEVRRLTTFHAYELQWLLDQLGHITKARNDILHLGLTSSDLSQPDKYLATNKEHAHARRVVRARPVTTATLKKMNADLLQIFIRLNFHRGLPLKGDFDLAKIMRAFRRLHPVTKLPAWQYKPPAQANSRPMRRVPLPKRTGRPTASSA